MQLFYMKVVFAYHLRLKEILIIMYCEEGYELSDSLDTNSSTVKKFLAIDYLLANIILTEILKFFLIVYKYSLYEL